MKRICSSCGTPLKSSGIFASVKRKLASNSKRVHHALLVLIAVLCLCATILNLSGIYDANVHCILISDESGVQWFSTSHNIGDLYERNILRYRDFENLKTVNLIYGIASGALALAAMLSLLIMRKSNSNKISVPLAFLGLGTQALYIIAFAIWGITSITFSAETNIYDYFVSAERFGDTMIFAVDVSFITWINAVLMGLLVAVTKVRNAAGSETAALGESCPSCGASLDAVQEKKPASKFISGFRSALARKGKSIFQIMLAVMAILCLFTAILNFSAEYHVYSCGVTKRIGEDIQKQTYYTNIGEVYEYVFDNAYSRSGFAGLKIVNILYGAGNAALALLAVVLLLLNSKSYRKKLCRVVTSAGLGFHMLYIFIFNSLGSISHLGLGGYFKYTVKVPFITWINLILFLLLVTLTFVKHRESDNPVAETVE